MKFSRFARDQHGGAALEFSLTSPILIMMLLGIGQLGLWKYSDFALQRGVTAAARYAAISYNSACATGANAVDVQNYASRNVIGFVVPAASFTIAKQTCGCQIDVSQPVPTFTTTLGTGSIQVTAHACFPT